MLLLVTKRSMRLVFPEIVSLQGQQLKIYGNFENFAF